MIELGLRLPTISVPLEVTRAAEALQRHFTPSELDRLAELLLARNAEDVA
jgi:hypothetical protein